jgi:hypothetical protein
VARERNWLTATHQLHLREAHGHIVKSKNIFHFDPRRSPEGCADSRQQSPRTEWLSHVIAGTHFQEHDFVRRLRLCAQNNNGQTGSNSGSVAGTACSRFQAVKMTTLSCHRFKGNEVRLWLSILAYNLGNLWRRPTLPGGIENWSLTRSGTGNRRRPALRGGIGRPYCNFAYSNMACSRTGISGSASCQS